LKILRSKKRGLGGFIIEPIISCGGQVELPQGFLKKSYEIIRKNGGICISDEVQVGCGRLGKSFWGFQLHDVVPDVVTIGKPLGNGHPIGAVVCTERNSRELCKWNGILQYIWWESCLMLYWHKSFKGSEGVKIYRKILK
jgi:4-aminobutyrate aminotransferase-like enzyme